MKKTISLILTVVVGVIAYLYEQGFIPEGSNGPAPAADERDDSPRLNRFDNKGDRIILEAYRAQRGDVQVEGSGVVKKVLRDDNKGSRHQRFLLELNNGLTLLVAHNIDLAPRIDGLKAGDTVAFFGEYEWNNQGGVMHWTHHDPGRRHVDGWLKHAGRTYQ